MLCATKRIVSLLTVAFCSAASAYGEVVVAWDTINGDSVAATTFDATITGNDLVRGTGVTENTGGDFNSRGWSEGLTLQSAIDANDYLQWGFSSSESIELTQIDIAYDRSSTGPTDIVFQANINNAGYTTFYIPTSPISSNTTIDSIDLTTTSLDFSSVTSIDFRLYGFGATSSVGTFDIETDEVGPGSEYGIAVSGNLTAVPEPSGLALLTLTFGGVGIRYWRKRSSSRCV